MDKLVLIDGNSLLNRAFYATPVFSTKDGQPTNAIFGFVKLMLKILSDVKPEYLAVAFDLKAPTFRHQMYDGYKATRKPMPQELAAQVEPLKSLLSAMKVAMFQKEGIEADERMHVIRLPENYGDLSPILHVVPLQLLAYHAALVRGTDVDKPRNLAKSVTVE